jgi:hypothetical protein
MPSIMANLMAAFAHFLPGPTDQSGDRSQTGWESQSPLAPSVLTALSDKATVENNELRVETPINGERANEVGG